MSIADNVFAADRAAARRHIWQVPLGLAAITVVFLFSAFLLAVLQVFGREISGALGSVLAVSGFILQLFFLCVTFFAIPQCFLIIRLGVTNVWARATAGFVSGWIYLFAAFFEAQLMSQISKIDAVALVSEMFLNLLLSLPHQIAVFFIRADWRTLLFFGLLGAAFGVLLWKPMYRLDNKRDWDNPILGGRPPYER